MNLQSWLPVFLAVLLVIGGVVAIMSVGVIFKRPCLRGSCGGPAVHAPGGEKLSCATCPNRHKHAHAQDLEEPT